MDTTILVHLSEPSNTKSSAASTLVKQYAPVQLSQYALHELLSGPIRHFCSAHNAILSSTHGVEALLSFAGMPPSAGRKKDVPLKVLAEVIAEVFTASPSGPRDEVKVEALEALALKIATYWLRAHCLKNVDTVQPLACFVDGDISIGSAGELRGPESFNCSPKERCAAAAYIYDDKASLKNLIECLHPDKLDDAAKEKQENSSRRNALKELLADGPIKFNKKKCRAIGDAYFAGMCPPGFSLATSNSVDFEPLCKVLGKKIVTPA